MKGVSHLAFPSCICQKITALSPPPDAAKEKSGANAIELTSAVCFLILQGSVTRSQVLGLKMQGS